jgi:hypothetical protein
MLVGAMVGHEIEQNFETPPMGLPQQVVANERPLCAMSSHSAVSANKGQTKSTPDHVSDAVPDNGTPCRR